MKSSYSHIPVLLDGVLEAMAPSPGLDIVDCTIGLGGHARELLGRISPGGRLIGLDLDPVNVQRAGESLREHRGGAELHVRHANFAALPTVLAELGITKVNGIL